MSANRGDTFTTLAGPPSSADVTEWGMRACDGMLAVWPLVGTSTATYVLRNGAWETLIDRPVLDVECTADETFLVSTFTGLGARVYRVAWDDTGTRSETFAPVSAPLRALAVGPNGTISGVSDDARTIVTSTDHGASFASRTVAQPLSALTVPDAVRTLNGVWTMAMGFPTWSPDYATEWSLRGLPGGDGLSYGIDVGINGQRRVAAMYVHPSAGGASGSFLFTSEDGGNTWQVASNPEIPIACMTVSNAGVFLGGVGDAAGVRREVRDPRGVRLIVADIVRAVDDTVALTAPIVGCAWTRELPAQSFVYIAQTETDAPVSRIRSADPSAGGHWITRPDALADVRITALDIVETDSGAALRVATEKQVNGTVRASRVSIEMQYPFNSTSEIDRNAVDGQAALQLAGTTALYPGNRVVVDDVHPARLLGLPAGTNISSARADDAGTLWFATSAGVFRTVTPIGP